MKESLKAFMNGIIDYAGLFPPADLPLDVAIQNYARYRTGPDSWMLSRFIIPARRLQELAPYAEELFAGGDPFRFSVLGRVSDTAVEYQSEVDDMIGHCASFVADRGGAAATDLMEVKLPREAALSHDVELLEELMGQTAEKLGRSAHTPAIVFYEGVLDEGWRRDTGAVIEALARHNERFAGGENYHYAAFKLRCGGVKPEHFPSVEQLAFVLSETRRHNVALKGTAGLHHPVRHYAESVQTRMHGFFNVFGGGMLAYANDLDEEELRSVLIEEDAEQFVFSDEALSWQDYSVTTQEIQELRAVALLSYGSCSFDEPREDLQGLNLMDQ